MPRPCRRPREALLRQLAAWSEAWDEQASSVAAVTAGTIQPGAGSPAVREQRAVTEFIAKRYRVAQDATAGFVATAYRVGGEWKVDPLLLLAVMAVESRYNPVAESNMGAKGLMQVIPKFHADKLVEHGGESALLDPHVNIQVGAQILREYLRRFGETETALQMYAGAFDEPSSVLRLQGARRARAPGADAQAAPPLHVGLISSRRRYFFRSAARGLFEVRHRRGCRRSARSASFRSSRNRCPASPRRLRFSSRSSAKRLPSAA